MLQAVTRIVWLVKPWLKLTDRLTDPLGEKSMASTFFRWPSSMRMHFPDRRSHTLPLASKPLQEGDKTQLDDAWLPVCNTSANTVSAHSNIVIKKAKKDSGVLSMFATKGETLL